MKKILLILITLLFINCKEKEKKEIDPNTNKPEKPIFEPSLDLSKNINNRIKVGDIVYIKPDSTKVIVKDLEGCATNRIDIIWFDKESGYKSECIDVCNIYLKE